MADIGTLTGILGSITGAVALILSIKSYVRVAAMKSIDLRLELERSFNNLDIVLSGLDSYLDFVHQSHIRVFAATGRNLSGEMKLFEEEFSNDKQRLQIVLGAQPKRATTYANFTLPQLEREIASLHAFHLQVAELRKKYQGIFESDEERRKEIRARHQL
jgi:hypothetical protein